MSIKKKMGAALVSTALGAALIGGGTFALFTDSAQNTGNTFASGTLNINLDKPDGTKYFDISNIAPGDSGSATVTVKNDGTLDLRYDIAQTLAGALAEGANGLKVTITDEAGHTVAPGDNNIVLKPGESDVLTVTWELPRDAGNEYQGKSATLGITVNAEQTKNN